MKKQLKIILRDLPKISLNKFFAREHWTKRRKMNHAYHAIIKSQCLLTFAAPCDVSYYFHFKDTPLDCSNCAAMAKMIEDVLFPDDSIKVVKSIFITSLKAETDYVSILVTEIL